MVAGPKYAVAAGTGRAHAVARVGTTSRASCWTEWIKRSKSRATSQTVISGSARLFARSERQSVMLATLLIIVASIAAGMIVHQKRHERREW
jgi:hypothetical protein